jgi:hypothetical protein
MSQPTAGARGRAGTGALGVLSRPAARWDSATGRPIGSWAFAVVALASFGGPLALAASGAPSLAADAADSAGLAMLAGAVAFTVPLAIWLVYSRHVHGAGGLFGFVEAAAGRKVALAQAAIWSFSYFLYIVYTTVQIVYDQLPAVVPGIGPYQSALALAIPVAIAAVMIAGRAAALLVIGGIAAGQLALAGILDGVTLAHVSTPASSFTVGTSGSVAKVGAQTSLLYVCGSLPVFLGGEVAAPARTIRRGLIGAFLVTAFVVLLAVAPLAAMPGVLHTDVPGVTVMQEFAGAGLAKAVGIGVAVSTAGLILWEYLALTRLAHAIGHWRIRPIAVAIGAVTVLAAPFSLIDPAGFYTTLFKPSLIALWVSQLIVFAVYPLYAARRGQRAWPAWLLSLGASAFALYGLWWSLQQASS